MPRDFQDVDVQVHAAVDPSDAVPLQQLQSLIANGINYKGTVGPASAAPAQPKTGDLLVVSSAGSLTDPSWQGLQGQQVNTHDVLIYEGGRWDIIGAAVDPHSIKAINGSSTIDIGGSATQPVVSLKSAPNTDQGYLLVCDHGSWQFMTIDQLTERQVDIYELSNTTETGDAKPGQVLMAEAGSPNPSEIVWTNKDLPAPQLKLGDLTDTLLGYPPAYTDTDQVKFGDVLMWVPYADPAGNGGKWHNVSMDVGDLLDSTAGDANPGDVLICTDRIDPYDKQRIWEHRPFEIRDLNNVELSKDWDKINPNPGNTAVKDTILAFDHNSGKWYDRTMPMEVVAIDSTRYKDTSWSQLPYYTLEYLQDYNHYIKIDGVFTPSVSDPNNHLYFEMVTQGGGQVDMTKWAIAGGGHAITKITKPDGTTTFERTEAGDLTSANLIASAVMICTLPYKDGLQPKAGSPIDLKMSLHFMGGKTAMKLETEYTSENDSVVNQKFMLQSDQVDLLTQKLWRLNFNFNLQKRDPQDPSVDQNLSCSVFSELA